MPGHLPSLDPESLRRLRRLVAAMHRGNGRGVPMAELVRLADEVELDGGVTIDFEASTDLGEPMVVLRMPPQAGTDPRFDTLSRRELEVVALVADGLSNKEIAGRLFISLATVKDHVHRILEKTGLSSRAEVMAAYLGRGSERPGR